MDHPPQAAFSTHHASARCEGRMPWPRSGALEQDASGPCSMPQNCSLPWRAAHKQALYKLGANGGARQILRHQALAPGDHVGASDWAELFRSDDSRDAHEFTDRDLVPPPGAGAAEVGEPLGFWRTVPCFRVLSSVPDIGHRIIEPGSRCGPRPTNRRF